MPEASKRVYHLYGLSVKCDWPLPCPGRAGPAMAEVELFEGPGSVFSEPPGVRARPSDGEDWFSHVRLSDGSDYLRWSGLFEFLVSADGRRIACRPLNGTPQEAFHTYLLGHVLSFALLKQGIEPLHSTAVVVAGGTVAFLGDCGYGKSSLGAAFLQAGHPLLTDDLLVVKEEAQGFVTYPGPPRIKLFPEVARRVLGERVTGTPMNHLTPKLVIPLGRDGKPSWRSAAPLKAIYVLRPPLEGRRDARISVRALSRRRAFVELVRNTFNAIVLEPARLSRQFDLAASLSSRIPVKALSFPRSLARLAEVRAAIESDLAA